MPAEPPSPQAGRLPDGFAVRLDPRVRRRDGGATLLGGSPLRLLRLSARAHALLGGDRLVVRDATTATLAARLLDAGVAVRVVTDACAGSSDDDHDRALRVMSLYAPLVELATTAQVLSR